MARPIGVSVIHPIELLARREALGLSQAAFANYVGVTQPSAAHWERGTNRVPEFAVEALEEFEAEAAALYARILLLGRGVDDLVLITHPNDQSFWDAHPEHAGLPAFAHRVACARAAQVLRDEGAEVEILPADLGA